MISGFQCGEFRLRRCAECGVGFVDPMPSVADLAVFYGGAYGPPWRPAEQNRAAAAFAHKLFDEAGVPDRTLLDFGGGAGVLGLEMKALGYEVSGLELSDRDRRLANQAGVPTVRDFAELHERRFGALVARHVIEHVPDPLETLRSLRGLLKPGGVLLIGVPNAGAAAARWFRSGWEWFTPPAHLWYFDPSSLTAVARRAGLQPVRTVATQGDASPFPLALATAVARFRMRRTAVPGFWRASPGVSANVDMGGAMRAVLIRLYLTLLRFSKMAWPWGSEELWLVCRG